MSEQIETYRIDVPQAVLDDLAARLDRTRRADAVADDWERGVRPSSLDRLLQHWQHDFDWRAAEEQVNRSEHLLVGEVGERIHVQRAGTPGATPLVLLHGWPDCFLRFEEVLPLLADRFDLVVPSLPGYGFSDPLPVADRATMADRVAAVMTALGLDRFGVHGGDVGAGVAEQLALRHPERLVGLHLDEVPYGRLFQADRDSLTAEEQDYLQRGTQWSMAEGAYAMLQRTKPQTLAAALTDSPAGLAAWFLEKFDAWGDTGDDVFDTFSLDLLCRNLTVYWATGTAGSAARSYFDAARSEAQGGLPRVEVPTGITIYPADLVPAPRVFGERWFDVVRWTEMPRGGHFAAWEVPDLFADELRAFFDGLEGS